MGIAFSPMFLYNSGTPYNVTIGSDLTGNNQFNARPTFARSSQCESLPTQYVSSPYGCLDTNPIGTDERIVPYGLGTGPVNIGLNLHLSRDLWHWAPRRERCGRRSSGAAFSTGRRTWRPG